MKKTTKMSKREKLALKIETIRTLTRDELDLVVGGQGTGGVTSGASKETHFTTGTC